VPPLIVLPDLASTVVEFTGDTPLEVQPSFNEVVAVCGTADWGPIGNEIDLTEPITTQGGYEGLWGTSDTQLRRGVLGALDGQGYEGAGGAGGVIVSRLAPAAAAEATRNINNTTPAAALTLTAAYTGTLGNDLSYVVEDDPMDNTKDRLRILFDGATVEKYTYTPTDIAGLAVSINAKSKYVTATSLISGVALTAGTNTLTGGNDGASVTATEFETMQDSLSFVDFSIFSAAGLTDAAIKVQLAAWEASMAAQMRPFRVVFGGAAAETLANVQTELSSNPSLRDEDGHIIRFGVGTYHDSLFDADLSTAEIAPRIAGALAARGTRSALTRVGFGRLTPVGDVASIDDLVEGKRDGITMLRQVSHPSYKLAVSAGVTTFIEEDVDGRPLELWSEPRLIGLFDEFIRGVVQWGDDIIISDLPVNDDTRAEVAKEVKKRIEELEENGLATPGTGFVQVPNLDDDPLLSAAIIFYFGFRPTRTANFLIGQGRVR
jgi:hypothetical protein